MKPNPGYRVKILELQQEKEKITIKVDLGEPDPKKVYAQVIVYPTSVAEVEKANFLAYTSLTFVFADQKGKPLATGQASF
jgi:hypothetical protein